MKLPWGKIAVATLICEVIPAAVLFGLVAGFGPHTDLKADEAFANDLGRWVGPLGGALVSFAGALWVGRGLRGGEIFVV